MSFLFSATPLLEFVDNLISIPYISFDRMKCTELIFVLDYESMIVVGWLIASLVFLDDTQMLKFGIALVFLVAVALLGVGIYAAVGENVRQLDPSNWCWSGALVLIVGLYWAKDYDASAKKTEEKNE